MAVSVATTLEQRVKEAAEPLAKALRLDLVGVKCQGRGAGAMVRVTIDKPGGVGIQDCEQLHHALSRALEVVDPMSQGYRLEVTSPGIDRPLAHLRDLLGALGKLVRVQLRQPLWGNWAVVGRMTHAGEERIVIVVRGPKGPYPLILNREAVAKVRLEVEFS